MDEIPEEIHMSNYRAIATACQGVADLLDRQYRKDDFKGSPMAFRVIEAKDLDDPPTGGVTMFLYRVSPDIASRNPPRKGVAALPLSLHFILTAWGKDAGQQQRILGWAMETLNENPVLDASVLNAVKGEVFAADESVEIALEDIGDEAMMRIWKRISPHGYHISVGYTARVRIG
jgi:hypothetical protein